MPANGLTTDGDTFAKDKFDYIVIGGGTAGLALAVRLSENPSIRVGVIEAGDAHLEEKIINTPVMATVGLFNPKFDWCFRTVPQEHVNGRTISINRGKMLGGTSGLNSMAWHRGSKEDYDSWSSPNWSYNSLLPFFKKSESVIPSPAGIFPGIEGKSGSNDDVAGRKGPVQISFNDFYTTLTEPFVKGLLELGVKLNLDPDNGDATGLFNAPHAVDPATGRRSYSTTAYFLPNKDRPNLAVLNLAQVTKILFSPDKDAAGRITATGVDYVSGGKTYHAQVTAEVIVSAGSIQTPQILELSGIGNPALLESFNIPVLVDLPGVGENLQDHPAVMSEFSLKDPETVTLDLFKYSPSFAEEQAKVYERDHTGPFTFSVNAFSFNPLQTFLAESEISTLIQTLQQEVSASNLTAYQKKQIAIQIQQIKEGKVAQVEFILLPASLPGKATPGQKRMTLLSFLSKPFSRGSVHITSSDPLKAPAIDPKFLSFSYDRDILIKTAQIARRLTETESFKGIVAEPRVPGPEATTHEAFEKFVLSDLVTEWHPIGTASLGSREEEGVVDENLIVHGTSNVRVADASVMPIQLAAHPQATLYAIAEKLAHMIATGTGKSK